jgi:hypothetical protein
LAIAIALVESLGCGKPAGPDLRLTNAQGSPEEVCQAALDALAANDAQALNALRLSRVEHDSILVPQLPIGKDTTGGKDLDMAWYMLDQRCAKGIRRAIADYGGQRYELISVRFTRPAERHGPLTVHRGTEVRVRDANGDELILGIFGSILQQDGLFKLVSIRD